MRKHSNENEFDLHEHELASKAHLFCTRTCFETETKGTGKWPAVEQLPVHSSVVEHLNGNHKGHGFGKLQRSHFLSLGLLLLTPL